jgi:hypothetical protein
MKWLFVLAMWSMIGWSTYRAENGLQISRTYWPVALDSAAIGHFHKHTHVAVRGRVGYVASETDGDTHIQLVSAKGAFIIAECTPKEPCTKPIAGRTIEVRGISRQDSEHGWWEVHPVESWSYVP